MEKPKTEDHRPVFYHSSRVSTPEYSLSSGFNFPGLKSNVESGEAYMDLPSKVTLPSSGEKKEEQSARDAGLKQFLERNHVLQVLSRSVTELYKRYTAMRPHPDPIEYFLEVLAEFVPRDPQQDQLDSEIVELKGMLTEIRQDCLTIQEKLNTKKPESLNFYREYSSSESETDDIATTKPKDNFSQSRRRQKTPSLGTRWDDTSGPTPPPPTPSTRHDKVRYGGKSTTIQRPTGRHQVQESLAWIMENQSN